jgi:hypothetical protein
MSDDWLPQELNHLRAELAEARKERDHAYATARDALTDFRTASEQRDEARKENERLRAALEPFAKFAECFTRKPLRQQHDILYAIHAGAEYEAELRRSDCEKAAAALATRPTP